MKSLILPKDLILDTEMSKTKFGQKICPVRKIFSERFSQAVVHYHSKKILLIESALVEVLEAMGVLLRMSRISSSHD